MKFTNYNSVSPVNSVPPCEELGIKLTHMVSIMFFDQLIIDFLGRRHSPADGQDRSGKRRNRD